MTYDAIVLGLGGMGAATAAELARRGQRVLGLEQFAPGHDRGSSHGQTRIIRTAYFEHPDYVPLCRGAFAAWRELERVTGAKLLVDCECLTLGPADGTLVPGVTLAAEQHGLAIERLTPDGLRRRYPQVRLDSSIVGVVESAAGFLFVDDCVRTLQAEAARHGADLCFDGPAIAWQADGSGVEVRTAKQTYRASRLAITAGPWAGRMLADLSLPLTVMRQTPMWFRPAAPERFAPRTFPIFIAETSVGCFYGLPAVDADGVKCARHYGASELSSPEGVSRDITAEDEVPVRRFLERYVPDAAGPRTRASVCLYTLTPDRHFIIDRHPRWPRVAIAAGFSGHGFKFAPVVGEVVADLLLSGRTPHPIGRFALDRFSTA